MESLKRLLAEKGVTSIWLANQIGITKVSISYIINGKQKPSFDTLEKIASALNVPMWRLFTSYDEVVNTAISEGLVTCPHCGKSIRVSLGCASDAGLSES